MTSLVRGHKLEHSVPACVQPSIEPCLSALFTNLEINFNTLAQRISGEDHICKRWLSQEPLGILNTPSANLSHSLTIRNTCRWQPWRISCRYGFTASNRYSITEQQSFLQIIYQQRCLIWRTHLMPHMVRYMVVIHLYLSTDMFSPIMLV